MKLERLSIKSLCQLEEAGMTASMLAMTLVLCVLMQSVLVLFCGGLLTACAFVWLFLLVLFFSKRLSLFTGSLCRMMDSMINGGWEPVSGSDSETVFARIGRRLSKLYGVKQENRHRVGKERRELQMLVSDISHQVKTPVSNLKMVTDTLLAKPVIEQERTDFLQGIRSQTDKLNFLMQSLVKSSRLESGAIRLERKDGLLLETLAQGMSGIVYEAEKKNIFVSADCPENLHLLHDGKWTAEALFNLLDNAVIYPSGRQHLCVGGTVGDVCQAECNRRRKRHCGKPAGVHFPAVLPGGGPQRAGGGHRIVSGPGGRHPAGRLYESSLEGWQGFRLFRVPSRPARGRPSSPSACSEIISRQFSGISKQQDCPPAWYLLI